MTKSLIVSIGLCVFILGAGQAAAQCMRPAEPTLSISGAYATDEELQAAEEKVLAYKAAIEGEDGAGGFLACLDEEEAQLEALLERPDADVDLIGRRKATIVQRYNAAVDDLNDVVNDFNQHVREHRAARGQ